MPPRGARKAASSAVATEPPRSPELGGNKRKPDDAQEQSSPLRRSKRVKSVEGLGTQSPSAKSTARTAPTESAESPKATPRKSRGRVVSVKKEVEEEETVTVEADIDDEDEVKDEEADEKPKVKAKVTRKRKTKEEVEMVPLRARTQGLRMCVGAHVSAAKGVFNAVHNSMHIGGNAFALFLKSQRKWDNPALQDDHRDQFRNLCIEHKYDGAKHILPHGSYLVNLAQEDKTKAKQAYDSFLDDLRRCEALGITLYNFHPGSANQTPHASAITRLAKALTSALSATSTVTPVLETMCGHGSTIGGYLHEFRDILSQIPQEYHHRIGICIDTCHSFAAGYDLSSPSGFASFMQEFSDVIGLQYLRALHLNDSKAPRGSKRDLHANIGTGFLGLRAFHNVMNEPRLEGLPMILETPIDRPEGDIKEEGGESSKGKKKKPAGTSAKLVPDFNVWAGEIALLESLIGMDPEGEEFRTLEAKLSEEGREMREKQMEQYERKMEAEAKKAAKKEKGQKTLMEMMNGGGKAKGSTKTKTTRGKKGKDESDGEGSDEEGCQSCSE
ncbi:apurinic or apyrimidinic site lyase [Aspergillus eucalypticola CBS 122712]|uniref:Apurinic-apyrimidinic endonuclease 1 n=1 Tax=Aspergillus eucalypticola (strain CBS 122712 / IBT 29274) TaxID=1448314 RepID=A0A317UQ50_ASPEC|nr:apurinic or apyrimidinic site lyase [Aspergillus eucalypticola CBS 122712]PWY64124.1 apurinic or apyrimidinic site lyase [Aspergillus eucalypticola CBS 122712]